MNNPIVPLIPISEQNGMTAVSGRDLHAFLEVETPYAKWFPRMVEYGFVEGQDYQTFLSDRSDGLPGKPLTNHAMTIDMAKELSMIQRTDRGKQARQYFIEVEKQRNAPALTEEQIVAQALQITVAKVQALESKIEQDAPKVNFWDTYCADDDKINFRTVASVLKVGEHDLRDCLIYTGWIYVETRSRWSASKQGKEYRNRYSEFSHKKPYFDRVHNPDAPRFGGELMHTLKVTIPGAEAIQRHVAKYVEEYGSLRKALPFLEAKYNERKAS